MTKKETLIISHYDKDPVEKDEKEEKEYKKGLTDFELDDFLSYLDGLKLDDTDTEKDKNGLARRGGGNKPTRGSKLRTKGPGSGPDKNKINLYTAQGVNSSCQVWMAQQRYQYYNQLTCQNRQFFNLNSKSSVKEEGCDVVDGPDLRSSDVQKTSPNFLAGEELDVDAAPILESIGKEWVDNIPALDDFLHKDFMQYENQRYDALTPLSQSTKSPGDPVLDDIMDVITDEEISRSPQNFSPDHDFISPVSPKIPPTFEFFSDKLFKEPELFKSGNLDFSFNRGSIQAATDIFTENSDNDNFKPFLQPFQDNSFVSDSISDQNKIQALKERQKHGLVPYIPGDHDVPIKRHQTSPLSDDDSKHLTPLNVDPETEKMISIDADGDSIIHSCIIAGISLDEFEKLLESLSSQGVLKQIIDKQNGMWRTALFLAVMEKRIDLADCLIGYHANPNIQGKVPYDMKKDLYDLRSPLHLVAGMGDEEIELLNLIIESDNLDINSRSESDRLTALHIALLSHKVDKDGKVIKSYSEVVKTLIDYGADVNIVEDRSSRTPIMLAIETADFQLVKEFMVSVPGHDTVRWALQEVTRAGDTPLHLAAGLRLCRENKIKMIRYLVKQGANTNAENNIKELPEDVATKEVWKDLFKVSR